jgi:hypothetical protein
MARFRSGAKDERAESNEYEAAHRAQERGHIGVTGKDGTQDQDTQGNIDKVANAPSDANRNGAPKSAMKGGINDRDPQHADGNASCGADERASEEVGEHAH